MLNLEDHRYLKIKYYSGPLIMKGSSDILSNLALHHNSQFRCRQPKGESRLYQTFFTVKACSKGRSELIKPNQDAQCIWASTESKLHPPQIINCKITSDIVQFNLRPKMGLFLLD